jgi:hypothetical protein
VRACPIAARVCGAGAVLQSAGAVWQKDLSKFYLNVVRVCDAGAWLLCYCSAGAWLQKNLFKRFTQVCGGPSPRASGRLISVFVVTRTRQGNAQCTYL